MLVKSNQTNSGDSEIMLDLFDESAVILARLSLIEGHKKFYCVVCDSDRVNQFLSHRQSMVPVHTVAQGIRSPQVILLAPLPSQSDLRMVRHCTY